jgi:hypothetical protein
MSSIPFWEDSPRLWDTVTIGGYTLPGIASVKGDVSRRVETANVVGSDGTRATDLGYGGCQVTVTLQLWEQAHLDAYVDIAGHIRPKATPLDAQGQPISQAPQALDVLHPALAAAGVRSLIVFRLGLPEKTQQKGVYEVQIELQEFVPEKKGTAKAITTSVPIADVSDAAAQRKTAQDKAPSATPPPPTGKK